MQLDLLRESLEAFENALAKGWEADLSVLYETIVYWETHWPPAQPEALRQVLDKALQNQRTRVFWQGHAYFPKEVLCELSDFAPDMINMAFGRLFNEELELGERYNGFAFYLDETLAEFNRAHPKKHLSSHYHEDHRASSLYCALRYPASHAYFEAEHYLQTLRYLRARDVGAVADPSRFAKSVKVIMTFAQKSPTLWQRHTKRLQNADFTEVSALLASEYIRFVSTELV